MTNFMGKANKDNVVSYGEDECMMKYNKVMIR